MIVERKVRALTEEMALERLKELGYGELKPFEIVTGGLLGGATLSKLFMADGKVWEFEEKPDRVRVYVYYVDDYMGDTYG